MLGYQYFDTGAMYRAVTFFFIKKNVDLSSNSQVVESLKAIKLQIDFSSESEMQIFLGEENISLKIRSQEVTSKVSAVSALKDVREMMVKIQRSFTESGNFVVEGRDIGTVVFPDAKYKFYLQADYDIRAKRRLVDFEKINEAKNINEIKEDLETRDKYDSTRKLSPLKKPEDAIIIDTTLCSFEEQVNQILKHIEK
jgi:cytidylate kinase